jgi:very-short-patch-repair endonuclease
LPLACRDQNCNRHFCAKYRVDFLWRAQKIIGEADGLAKYGSDEKAIRANLKAERVRERELQDAGYSIVRWMWDDIWFTPETVVAQISRKLRR